MKRTTCEAFPVQIDSLVNDLPPGVLGGGSTVPAPRAAAGEPGADSVVADLLLIPGAPELLVACGFALRDPVMRAVTLRQACQMYGIALEALVVELRALATTRR